MMYIQSCTECIFSILLPENIAVAGTAGAVLPVSIAYTAYNTFSRTVCLWTLKMHTANCEIIV